LIFQFPPDSHFAIRSQTETLDGALAETAAVGLILPIIMKIAAQTAIPRATMEFEMNSALKFFIENIFSFSFENEANNYQKTPYCG